MPNGVTYNEIVQENLKRGEYEDAAKFVLGNGCERILPRLIYIHLADDLLHKCIPALYKMIQKFAPERQ